MGTGILPRGPTHLDVQKGLDICTVSHFLPQRLWECSISVKSPFCLASPGVIAVSLREAWCLKGVFGVLVKQVSIKILFYVCYEAQ